MKRRNFLKALAAGMLACVAAPAYGTWIEPSLLDIVELQAPLRRTGAGLNGLRAVQISDLHAGPWFSQSRLTQIVERIVSLKPEVVFITGDFITHGGDYPSMKQVLVEPLRALARQVPVFSVLGNHDYGRRVNIDLSETFSTIGVQDVSNSFVPYRRGGDPLIIAGVGSALAGYMQLERLKQKLPKGSPAILLAHEPDIAKQAQKTSEFVFQFSGHTHGGQVALPGGEPIIRPRLGRLYPTGLYDLGTMYVYTNRGLGMTAIPIRLNCPPEITIFNFTTENSA